MSERKSTDEIVLSKMYKAAAAAALRNVDLPFSGDQLAAVLFVKGALGPAELAGGPVLSGEDGEALAKALPALGYEGVSTAAVLSTSESGCLADLHRLIEVVDPLLVIMLDRSAAADVAAAFSAPGFSLGNCHVFRGRRYVALDGFEESLSSPEAKRVSWEQLKCARREGPLY